MNLPTGSRARQLQLGLLACLVVVWWLTRPTEAPQQPSEPATSTDVIWGPAPAWMSNIDTGKPECVELQQEILQMLARGAENNLIYLGDCDKRLKDQAPDG